MFGIWKGSYVGASFDVLLSIGYDEVILGKGVAETVRGNGASDGYQISVGIGLGLTWVHVGDSYTIIKMIKYGEQEPAAEKKVFKPKKKRKVGGSHSLQEVCFIP